MELYEKNKASSLKIGGCLVGLFVLPFSLLPNHTGREELTSYDQDTISIFI